MDRDTEKRELSTADLLAASQRSERELEAEGRKEQITTGDDELAALFAPDQAREFKSQWDNVQRSFVDDPRQAVRKADELVAQVMKNLAESFSRKRSEIEAEADEKASTENLRLAFRHYRSFFERLLSL